MAYHLLHGISRREVDECWTAGYNVIWNGYRFALCCAYFGQLEKASVLADFSNILWAGEVRVMPVVSCKILS